MTDSKHFCLIPWTHLHTWPNSNVYMCCGSDSQVPLGKLSNETTLKDIWNCDRIKKNRLLMLEDKPVPECSRCYEIEKHGGESLRTNHNRHFANHMDVVETTREDGHVEKFNISYVDFRFSNFCNLRCRTCGPELSSKWGKDVAKIFPEQQNKYENVIKPDIDQEIFWEQIEEILPNIESVYFAGGEPLLMEEHYKLLDLLIAYGKTDIRICYNSNFTSLRYKDKFVVDYWNKFSDITVCASIDSWGARCEYMRKDLKWTDIEQNFKTVKEQSPHVKIDIGLTLSIFNFSTLVEFYDYAVEKEFIHQNGLNISILTDPVWYKPSGLPLEYRKTIAAKYKQKITMLEAENTCSPHIIERFNYALQYIMSEEEPSILPLFKFQTKMLDRIRSESFVDVFPELRFIFDE